MSGILTSSRVEKVEGSDGDYISYRVISTDRLHIDGIWCGASNASEKILIELIRQIVERVFNDKLTLSATVWSDSRSHIFFLKMGMIPDDFPLSYAAWEYGEEGYRALEAEKASDVRLRHYKVLREILENEQKFPEDSAHEVFKGVLERKYSFLKDIFVPRLFSLLNSKGGKAEFPDCSRLGAMNMRFSERGIKRWKNAIEDELPFVPFTNFEHLEPFLRDWQKILFKSMIM